MVRCYNCFRGRIAALMSNAFLVVMMTIWHLSTTMIASDDDIDVPMCLARADEVAYGAV
jgi:hypothetical protein